MAARRLNGWIEINKKKYKPTVKREEGTLSEESAEIGKRLENNLAATTQS